MKRLEIDGVLLGGTAWPFPIACLEITHEMVSAMQSPYDEACEYLLATCDHQDARLWLSKSAEGSMPRLTGFDAAETSYIINNVYAMGADCIHVVWRRYKSMRDSSPCRLLIELPDDLAIRRRLFAFQAQVADETGRDPEMDDGNKYLYVAWSL